MSEKYIRENVKSCNIVKNSKTYAKVTRLEDAIFIRDLLIDNEWNLDEIPQTIWFEDNCLVLSILDEKIYIVAKYKDEPSQEIIDKIIKRHRRNPNNSRYGLNITRVFDTFIIKKQIAGDDYVFGVYDNLEDASFVRNFLLDCNWNVNEFETLNYCDETDTFKVVAVIDDRVYVVDSSKSPDFDLNDSYKNFLSDISKHKYGLANHPHLDDLKDSIEELEDKFGVRAADGVWSFQNAGDEKSALNDIIFALTPFEQSVYDAIDGEKSFDEIKTSLIRYRSKNFEDKIKRNLDSLIEKGLVERTGSGYRKTNV